ncbi:HAMP domain-containing sensor histidine kinase [Aeromicrobium chenweiae]|uniref:histidine kinase n=1 Tax=Aeromicrobium chenweiae TaxID=2079793 RepID=A0A2S0WNK3_9ACTN|nr:histidine kinase [Aeromicrobium chenweiae]AWB92891.1 sensor histidine kinase [Aeromicrobium chenweiae]TGN33886.1 HAMP domain-containing protein [Aeromicrobium chenweiae]
MTALTRLPLYWRICLINGLVFLVGTVVLAASPATISTRVLVSEAIVLLVGLVLILFANALLIRSTLAPLERLTRLTESVDLQSPREQLSDDGHGTVARLFRGFNAMLDRLEAERSSSNAKALAAQEAERHRIAQELHDEVGQGLTAVLLGLKRATDRAPDDLADELRGVAEIARSSLDEVRDVARRLRPGVLDDLGLLSALAAACTDFSTHSGVHVRRGFAPGLPPLSAEKELVVYRVAQEALTNVARHALASTVTVSLSTQGDAVVLLVADDGVGIHGRAESTGIRGMRERARLVEGSLVVRTRIGGGTEVRLVVPTGTVTP